MSNKVEATFHPARFHAVTCDLDCDRKACACDCWCHEPKPPTGRVIRGRVMRVA